jgi:hypothetical protein
MKLSAILILAVLCIGMVHSAAIAADKKATYETLATEALSCAAGPIDLQIDSAAPMDWQKNSMQGFQQVAAMKTCTGPSAGGPVQCDDKTQQCCRVGVTVWCCGIKQTCGDLQDCK